MRQIFNSFCLASTVVACVNQSAKANQIVVNYIARISSQPQTIKLNGGNAWQKIKQVRALTIAQTRSPQTPQATPPATNTPGFPQNLRSRCSSRWRCLGGLGRSQILGKTRCISSGWCCLGGLGRSRLRYS